MNKEQQRIAIAEACGWRIKRRDITGFNVWEPGSKLPAQLSNNLESKIPNYTGDLNAMHEAEKVLINRNEQIYFENLHDVAGNLTFYRATAAQRAEAFLKTLNLWTNDATKIKTNEQRQRKTLPAFSAGTRRRKDDPAFP